MHPEPRTPNPEPWQMVSEELDGGVERLVSDGDEDGVAAGGGGLAGGAGAGGVASGVGPASGGIPSVSIHVAPAKEEVPDPISGFRCLNPKP